MTFTTKDWKDYPDTTTPITAAALEDLETRLAAYVDQIGGTLVTSLPGSPVDGQVVHFLADATNGVVWQLRYRSASSSAYKWEFIGGPDLTASQLGTDSVTATTYAVPPTNSGPNITAPLAGDYLVQIGASIVSTTAAGAMSYTVGATAANDTWAIYAQSALSNFGRQPVRHNGLSASDSFATRLRVNAGAATINNRYMAVRPVRLG